MTIKKEEFEKHITPSYDGKQTVFNHLIIVTSKFRELMEKHGAHCKRCNMPFIPQPYYRENYPSASHYPTDTICGFCIYDMDSYDNSILLTEVNDGYEDYGSY